MSTVSLRTETQQAPLSQRTLSSFSNTETIKKIGSKVLCDHCQQELTKPAYCGKCRAVAYCNEVCQKAAWTIHSKACYDLLKVGTDGLTPLHRAVLAGEPLTQKQIEFLDVAHDAFGATPRDLLKLLEPLPEKDALVCKMETADGNVHLTADQFFKETGIHFAPGYRGTVDEIKRRNKREPSKRTTSYTPIPLLPSQFSNFSKNPPELSLQKHPFFGFGVVTDHEIPADTILCKYTGDLVDAERLPNFKSTQYFLGGVNAALSGGPGAFVNDGPPNCEFRIAPLLDGVPHAPTVVSSRNLDKKEALYANYGAEHNVKLGIYRIDPKAYQEVVSHCSNFYEASSRSKHSEQMTFYILDTPAVFARLHLEGHLDIKKTKKLLAKPEMAELLAERRSTLVQERLAVLKAIEIILLQTKELKPSQITRLMDSLSVSSFISVLFAMAKKGSKISSEEISDFRKLGKIIDELRFYVYGTLTGSYHFETAEKKPNLQLDIFGVTEKVASLPLRLQLELILTIELLITICQKSDYKSEKVQMEQLLFAIKLFIAEQGPGQLLKYQAELKTGPR